METTFVMFVAKNQPLSIVDGFLKIVSDLAPNSKQVKKYGAGKNKTTEIKDKGVVISSTNRNQKVTNNTLRLYIERHLRQVAIMMAVMYFNPDCSQIPAAALQW